MAETRSGTVLVVGHAARDLVLLIDDVPDAGGTTDVSSRLEMLGGKGANQAVGAARTAPTAFVGCVGTDEAGQRTIGHLQARGVVTDELAVVEGETGRAVITVADDEDGSSAGLSHASRAITSVRATARPAAPVGGGRRTRQNDQVLRPIPAQGKRAM